jgi:RNA polymerase sigma-70 factor (ECF subfamily)
MEDQDLQAIIDNLQGRPNELREALVQHAFQRLRLLTAKFIGGYSSVRRWEETDDVLQNASLRLWKSLSDVPVENVKGFFGLAAKQIRRELIDLARHYHGPQGLGANHATDDKLGPEGEFASNREIDDPTGGPVTLSEWTELHAKVEELPAELKTMFDLLYYQGMTQPEAAALMGQSLRTFKRRWRDARQALYRLLHGMGPGHDMSES